MKHKKYIGETMNRALQRAKDDLGEDISILESREIRNKNFEGGAGVEITVAVLESPEGTPAVPGPAPAPKNDPRTDAYFNDFLTSAFPEETKVQPQKSDKLENEVQILREELNKLNNSLRKIITSDFPREYSKVYERLQNTGMGKQDVEELVRHAFIRLESVANIDSRRILDSMKSEIDTLFPLNGNLFTHNKNRVYTFIGPTGVGKTTTIMKLASNPAILGNRKAGIISTDTYRMAGTEALKVFSKVAGVPVIECKSGADLPAAMKQLAELDVILIDTAGRSPYFPNYIQELQGFLGSIADNKVILTLSATSDLEDLYFAAGLYTVLKPMGIVFTKLDETGRPGKLFSMVKHLGLAPLFFSNGQAVPQDINPATGSQFWTILNDAMI